MMSDEEKGAMVIGKNARFWNKLECEAEDIYLWIWFHGYERGESLGWLLDYFIEMSFCESNTYIWYKIPKNTKITSPNILFYL